METRSHTVLVGVVLALLLGALLFFILWLGRLGATNETEYQIVFQRSVQGLVDGSPVTLSGAPAGHVTSIATDPQNPYVVRVMVSLREDIGAIPGLTADLASNSFTGAAQIDLEIAEPGARRNMVVDAAGIPTIPAVEAGEGLLAGTPGDMVGNLSRTVQRLNDLLTDKTSEEIAERLERTNVRSAELAAAARTSDSFERVPIMVADFRQSAERAGEQARRLNETLGRTGRPKSAEIRTAIRDADRAIAQFDARTEGARTTLRGLTPAAARATQQVRALRGDLAPITESIRNVEQNGLIGGN